MAEVHLIGQLLETRCFDEDRSVFVKWSLSAGSCWTPIEGYTEGQTQMSLGSERFIYSDRDEDDERIVCHSLSHPIDVHYATNGLQGWPKFEFQVWGVDWMNKCNISAYGFMNVPTRPGRHNLTCHTWRPVGDFRRRFIDYITGQRMHLVDPSDTLGNGMNRHMIQTASMGSISVELTVVLKDFADYQVDL